MKTPTNAVSARKAKEGSHRLQALQRTVIGLSPSTRISINGKQYARGQIRFVDSAQGFHVVVTVGLEAYLYGLAEVPSSWPTHALRAQAIIGRSCAVATAVQRGGADGAAKLSTCGCHLFSTTADQAYAGWSKESPAAGNFGAQWVAAVQGTDRSVLIHPQSTYALRIARAFYSSSNGGASENVEFVWGGEALPWLRSVGDKWSADPDINPLAHWTVVVPAPRIAAHFGWDRVTNVRQIAGPPGAVIEFTGNEGVSTVTGKLWGEAEALPDRQRLPPGRGRGPGVAVCEWHRLPGPLPRYRQQHVRGRHHLACPTENHPGLQSAPEQQILP